MKHTPEPWRWELNEKSKDVHLCGGSPKYDMCIMDFVRWGMGGATPRFNSTLEERGLMIMEPAKKFSQPVEGREHHASWFKGINHPDANRIVDCINACAGIEDPAAAIQAARDVLKQFSECELSESNCASFDIANRRIRSLAHKAINLLNPTPTPP